VCSRHTATTGLFSSQPNKRVNERARVLDFVVCTLDLRLYSSTLGQLGRCSTPTRRPTRRKQETLPNNQSFSRIFQPARQRAQRSHSRRHIIFRRVEHRRASRASMASTSDASHKLSMKRARRSKKEHIFSVLLASYHNRLLVCTE
jgi:hypothetical protein